MDIAAFDVRKKRRRSARLNEDRECKVRPVCSGRPLCCAALPARTRCSQVSLRDDTEHVICGTLEGRRFRHRPIGCCLYQGIVSSDVAIQAMTASEKPSTRVHAPCPTPCWYEATFTM